MVVRCATTARASPTTPLASASPKTEESLFIDVFGLYNMEHGRLQSVHLYYFLFTSKSQYWQ